MSSNACICCKTTRVPLPGQRCGGCKRDNVPIPTIAPTKVDRDTEVDVYESLLESVRVSRALVAQTSRRMEQTLDHDEHKDLCKLHTAVARGLSETSKALTLIDKEGSRKGSKMSPAEMRQVFVEWFKVKLGPEMQREILQEMTQAYNEKVA